MKCLNCGHEHQQVLEYCLNCGENLLVSREDMEQRLVEKEKQEGAAKLEENTFLFFLFSLGAFLIVLGVQSLLPAKKTADQKLTFPLDNTSLVEYHQGEEMYGEAEKQMDYWLKVPLVPITKNKEE